MKRRDLIGHLERHGCQFLREGGPAGSDSDRDPTTCGAIAVAIDAPLMLLGGPMKMSLGQYMADIGVAYLCIPAVVWGIGQARSWTTAR